MTKKELSKVLRLNALWEIGDPKGKKAVLWKANLQEANLQRANLQGADLRGADLWKANLQEANLQRANLQRANLQGADLRGADLWMANLQGADLRGADLWKANLQEAKNTELAILETSICPEGDLIVWKKLKNNKIAKLLIPKEAKRSNATGRKCRAEFADVLEISDKKITGYSLHDNSLYKVGKRKYSDKWDDNRWNECSNGIHFFITKEEAERFTY